GGIFPSLLLPLRYKVGLPLREAPSLGDAVRVRVYVPQRNCQKIGIFWVSRPSTQPTFWLRHPTKV
ncbi:hypothetical protein, partial [Nostoc sp.]